MRATFFILFVATASFGADKPKVVLVPFTVGEGATETSAGKFTRLFAEELNTRDDVLQLMPAPATAKAAAPPPPVEKAPEKAPAAAGKKGPSAEAVAALDNGKKALAELRFDEAIVALKKGIELSLADPATADFPAVLEAYISLGVSAFRIGDDKEASGALFNLARLDPNYQLPAGYPPIFGREFEKAKKKVGKQPKASVAVDGPAGSTAFVDGRDLGMVPVLEENLAPGLHYVKVEGSKGEKYGHTVDLKSGTAKVKASFTGEKEEKRTPVAAAPAPAPSGGVADPRVGALLDADTQTRIAAFAKAAGAEWAVVGIIYRTGDQQLTAGTALYSAKKQALASLPPISFDSDVLTANVEAYKLADALGDKLASFASSSMPIALVTKGAVKVASGGTSATKDEIAGVTAQRKVLVAKKDEPKKEEPKPELTPKEDVRALENKSNVVGEEPVKHDEPPPGAVVKSGGVPVWVWIVAGVAVAAGGGVGAYFGVSEANKPVTGSVTATW